MMAFFIELQVLKNRLKYSGLIKIKRVREISNFTQDVLLLKVRNKRFDVKLMNSRYLGTVNKNFSNKEDRAV